MQHMTAREYVVESTRYKLASVAASSLTRVHSGDYVPSHRKPTATALERAQREAARCCMVGLAFVPRREVASYEDALAVVEAAGARRIDCLRCSCEEWWAWRAIA